MSHERRKHTRVAADAPATISDSGAEPSSGTIANFSERGIFLRAGLSPKLHRPVHVHFILKPDHTVCEASGKVAWLAPHGIGITFDQVNQNFVAFVHELATAATAIDEAPKRAVLERILGEADIAFE